jgi:hypothetical protein
MIAAYSEINSGGYAAALFPDDEVRVAESQWDDIDLTGIEDYDVGYLGITNGYASDGKRGLENHGSASDQLQCCQPPFGALSQG